MRLALRLLGTWLLAIALILLIVDGTKSLAATSVVLTSLDEVWSWLNADSLAAFRMFLQSRLFGPLLEPATEAALALPAWLVLAVPGAIFAWLGRSRRTRTFIEQDQF